MRLISRQSTTKQRHKVPRISISQAEITADLHYPARRQARAVAPARGRGAGR